MGQIDYFERGLANAVKRLPDGKLKQFYSQLSIRILLAFIVFAVATMLFVAIANEMREQDTLPLDNWILQNVHQYFGSRALDAVMPTLTEFGGVIGISALCAVVAIVFWSRKQYRRVHIVLAGVGGAVILNQLLKMLFARVRPDLWEQLVVEHSFSFPSGHSMASSALAFSLIVALWYTRWRWFVVMVGLVYVLFIGFSRLYLGVHYPTDIVAGWALSVAWVLVVWMMFRGSKRAARLHDRT